MLKYLKLPLSLPCVLLVHMVQPVQIICFCCQFAPIVPINAEGAERQFSDEIIQLVFVRS